jgi:hypothetical protein
MLKYQEDKNDEGVEEESEELEDHDFDWGEKGI